MLMIGGPEEPKEVMMGLSHCYQCGRKWVDTSVAWSRKPCKCRESVGWEHASRIVGALVTWDEREES